MKTAKSLWRVSVVTTPEAEDAVSELLGSVLGQPVSSYFDLETGLCTVTVYCRRKLAWPGGIRGEIAAGLVQIEHCGLKIGSGKVTQAKVRREDWAESWKRHFKPIEVSGALLVKPSWSRKTPREHQAVVVLDPGLSFGTGQHPTTAFCLRELARCGKIRTGRSFFDIGTGSGILAIAATKLGYSPVHAIDFDPEAVRVARANARANGVHNQLRIAWKDVTKLPIRPARRYDLICANLISTLLISERRRLVAHMHRGGTLVLAGILKPEFSQVRKSFSKLGLKLAGRKIENEWCSGSFCFTKKNNLEEFE
ncbi:MAG: 50S ribosomal protein L11 methyltransferase [Verrucomicrobiota bacterium]|jgi:ribosomal protein L11 methyltransferase